MWDIKTATNKQENKLVDADSRMVVTRREEEWGQDEEGKGGQTQGDGRRLDSVLQRCASETYIMLFTNVTPIHLIENKDS